MVLLQSIPSCVMGGVCLTLYGFIAVSGLKMFKDIDLSDNKNLFVVSVILIAGIGGLTIQIPYSAEIAESLTITFNDLGIPEITKVVGGFKNVITITGIATALILGIITNAILTKVEKSKLILEVIK
jgi:uracil permease